MASTTTLEGWEEFDRRSAPSPRTPTVTIQRKGMLSLNRAAYDLLGGAKSVTLMYNRDRRAIGLRPCAPDNPRAYPVRIQGNGATYIVAGTAFSQRYGVDTSVARRYRPEKQGDLLVVDLNQDAPDVTGSRTRRTTIG